MEKLFIDTEKNAMNQGLACEQASADGTEADDKREARKESPRRLSTRIRTTLPWTSATRIAGNRNTDRRPIQSVKRLFTGNVVYMIVLSSAC